MAKIKSRRMFFLYFQKMEKDNARHEDGSQIKIE